MQIYGNQSFWYVLCAVAALCAGMELCLLLDPPGRRYPHDRCPEPLSPVEPSRYIVNPVFPLPLVMPVQPEPYLPYPVYPAPYPSPPYQPSPVPGPHPHH